jgi:hypothetical protein
MTARAPLLLACLLLVGCTVPTGGGRSLWVPSTWLGGDAAAKQDRAARRVDDAQADVLRGAQEAVVGAGAALATDPDPAQPAQAAAELVGTARRGLDRALGPLPPATEDAAARLGRDLATLQGEQLAEARRRLKRQDETMIRLLERLADREAAFDKATAATAEAQRQYLAAQATINRQRFLLWGTIIALVAACILIPGAAGLVAFVMRRWKTAVAQIGSGIESWSVERPAEAAELQEWLTSTMDKLPKRLVKNLKDSGQIKPHPDAIAAVAARA